MLTALAHVQQTPGQDEPVRLQCWIVLEVRTTWEIYFPRVNVKNRSWFTNTHSVWSKLLFNFWGTAFSVKGFIKYTLFLSKIFIHSITTYCFLPSVTANPGAGGQWPTWIHFLFTKPLRNIGEVVQLNYLPGGKNTLQLPNIHVHSMYTLKILTLPRYDTVQQREEDGGGWIRTGTFSAPSGRGKGSRQIQEWPGLGLAAAPLWAYTEQPPPYIPHPNQGLKPCSRSLKAKLFGKWLW